ncbi:Disease resistance protein L6 [Linum perenne]
MCYKVGAVMLAAARILLHKMLSIKKDSNKTNYNNATPLSKIDSKESSNTISPPDLVSLPSVEYEVFLSFRGPDTRDLITNILYRFLVHSKIHTFKDDDELRKGEDIWPNLERAIDQSKIYVPIISKSYAHSKWCLKELAEIVQRQKEDKRRIILPIFYMVDPRDIRHQTGPYQDAFQPYARSFDENTIQSWKDALSIVGSLKGWHVKSNNEVVAILDQVYATVWSHLSKDNSTFDTDEPVGIDNHIKALTDKLSLDSDEGVIMAGIYGLGGVGKTTIAKAVYNKISYRFDRCCFLEDIREKQEKDGNVFLQKKLISDILRMDSVSISDENGGRKMIKERVSLHKVLIVLDDVDENFRFEDILGSPKDFVPGSRFIVTSRNTKILSTLNDNQCRLQEVEAMDQSLSLELFCKHAFKKNSPPVNFKILSNKIVATTGGLPLTLKVIGSLLFKEDIPVWEEKLGTNQVKAIRVNSSSVVLRELKSECFTNLSELRYLDAKATKLTGDFSNLLPDLMWLRLPEHKNASMASFQMKNLRAEKLKVLNLAGCGNLEKIPSFPNSGSLEILDLSQVRSWSQDQMVLDISKLKKLIVLRLDGCRVSKITGGTIGMMEELQELDLTDFYFGCENSREVFIDIGKLSKLEILRQIEGVGSRNMQDKTLAGIKLPISLKELETSSPIPNLEEMVELEELTVVNCDDGVDIPPSSSLWYKVSKLKHLSLEKTKVNASSSSSLLPTSLTNLDMDNCRVLVYRTLIPNLENLEWVPNLENLENLTEFSIKNCTGPKEIHGLGGLKSLKSLEIDSVGGLTRIHGLEFLMSSSSNCKLEKLRIHGCLNLDGELSIQHEDGNVVESLRQVSITRCGSWRIGSMIRNMSKFPRVRNLELGDLDVAQEDIEGICCLEELEELKLDNLWNIERIPSLSKLQNLKDIEINNCMSLREIEGLEDLKSLRTLHVTNCESLERLFLPTKKKKQQQQEEEEEKKKDEPQLSINLENLQDVDIRNCTKLSDEDLILLHKMLSIKKDSNKTNYNNTTPPSKIDSTESTPPPSKIDSTESSNTISPPDLVSLPSVEYEVFLSFRGPDTRDLITNILYRFLVHSKIHTFKDDDELRKGEDIWPNLERAIDQSKIYVPIISKSYAHSKWCLKELAEIVQRQKEDKRRIILPIFYMVDPRDIRHQTGPYQDAFQPYARSFDENTIQSWKDALSIVGSLKGWHVKSNDEVVAILDQVYSSVWSHLSKDNSILDTDETVGIDDHIKVLTDKLSLDSNEGVIMAGIYGIGGVGKTTIAKAVYNKISYRFGRCCFLKDIREKQEKEDGNVILQKKLISDILKMDSVSISDENGGRKMIKERVSRHKVLIVLDDVDENFIFEDILGSPEDFVPGSRFIVTSRNTKILSTLNDNQCQLHEVGAMDHSRSLELFCKHAFKKNSPPLNFKILSNKIVATTGGLPLTLKVIGSLLFKEDIPVWEEKLVQLRETPEFEVIKRLKISYDTLSYEAQQIFLDIACFFIGTNKELPCYMWRDCIYYPTSNINILVQRSMLKVGENNEFQMHDQLRDMGREIVRWENIDHPGMRSRIWSDKDALNLLSNKKGTNQVKAIRVNSSSVVLQELKSECFTNLSELRYLDAKATKLTGDFSNLLPDLMWLRLPEHKNASMASFQMKNLRAEKLKVLNLAKCGNLEKIPSFTDSGSLEILDLSYVRRWSQDQEVLNISKLKKLIVLRLKNCSVSKITGGTIGMMEGLRELDLTDFYFGNLREVFIDIGKLSKLEILRQIEWADTGYMQERKLAGIKLPTSLKELETSSPIPNLEELVELEKLTVVKSDHGFDIPPSSSLWCKVSKLKHLSLEKTKVNASSSSSLLPTSLTNLDINNCRVSVWVLNMENMENLTQFSIKDCEGPKEIQGLKGLKSLKSLEIDSVEGLTQIHGLEALNSPSFNCKLEKLRIHGCRELERALVTKGKSILVTKIIENTTRKRVNSHGISHPYSSISHD